MPLFYKVSAEFFYIEGEKAPFDFMKAKSEELDAFEQILHDNFTPTFGFLEVYRTAYGNVFGIMYREDEDEMLVKAFPEDWAETYLNKVFQVGENLSVMLSGVHSRDEDDEC